MRLLFAALAATLLCASSAHALQNPTGIVSSFTLKEIQSVLSEIGIASEQGKIGDFPTVRAQTPDGFRFTLTPLACLQDGRCVGLDIMAVYTDSSQIASPAIINEFDAGYPFLDAMQPNPNTVVLNRYAIADFGIPRGNIASNITNFIGIALNFPAFVRSYGQVSQLEKLTPSAAAILSERSAEAFDAGRAHFGAPSMTRDLIDAVPASDRNSLYNAR